MKKNNFHALLAKATGRRALLGISLMLAATAGLMTACTSNDDNPATPSGPSESVIKEKILGKWKRVKEDGEERVTNNRVVLTYFADGKMTYSRSSYSDYWKGYNLNISSKMPRVPVGTTYKAKIAFDSKILTNLFSGFCCLW